MKTLSHFYYQSDHGSFASAASLWQWCELQAPIIDLMKEFSLESEFKGNITLLNALTHPSFIHESPQLELEGYERLEFLGDAILDLHISELLLERYPTQNEGELSKFRGALVNEDSLYELAQCTPLSRCMLVGRGEFKTKSYKRKRLLADMIESFLAAIYLVSGFKESRKVLLRLLSSYQTIHGTDFMAIEQLENFDAKTKLQELTMAQFKIHPTYEAHELSGEIEVSLLLNKCLLAKTKASSKKIGEQKLAQKVLKEKLYLKTHLSENKAKNKAEKSC